MLQVVALLWSTLAPCGVADRIYFEDDTIQSTGGGSFLSIQWIYPVCEVKRIGPSFTDSSTGKIHLPPPQFAQISGQMELKQCSKEFFQSFTTKEYASQMPASSSVLLDSTANKDNVNVPNDELLLSPWTRLPVIWLFPHDCINVMPEISKTAAGRALALVFYAETGNGFTSITEPVESTVPTYTADTSSCRSLYLDSPFNSSSWRVTLDSALSPNLDELHSLWLLNVMSAFLWAAACLTWWIRLRLHAAADDNQPSENRSVSVTQSIGLQALTFRSLAATTAAVVFFWLGNLNDGVIVRGAVCIEAILRTLWLISMIIIQSSLSKGLGISRTSLTEGECVSIMMQCVMGSIMCLLTVEDDIALYGWNLFVLTFLGHNLLALRRSLKFSWFKLHNSYRLGLRSSPGTLVNLPIGPDDMRDLNSKLRLEIWQYRTLMVSLSFWASCQIILFLSAPQLENSFPLPPYNIVTSLISSAVSNSNYSSVISAVVSITGRSLWAFLADFVLFSSCLWVSTWQDRLFERDSAHITELCAEILTLAGIEGFGPCRSQGRASSPPPIFKPSQVYGVISPLEIGSDAVQDAFNCHPSQTLILIDPKDALQGNGSQVQKWQGELFIAITTLNDSEGKTAAVPKNIPSRCFFMNIASKLYCCARLVNIFLLNFLGDIFCNDGPVSAYWDESGLYDIAPLHVYAALGGSNDQPNVSVNDLQQP